MRPAQAYISKLPRDAAALIIDTRPPNGRRPSHRRSGVLGGPLAAVETDLKTKPREPFEPDPDAVDRGTNGHRRTQEALRSHLLGQGFDPRGPHPDGPNIDVGWQHDDVVWIAEIKSLTPANEERQLRLALGQVLRYCHVIEV